MENTNPTPILQLRQDDVVAIPLERYEELIACETRLTILYTRRRDEILDFKGYTSEHADDHILSPKLKDAWAERERLCEAFKAELKAKEAAEHE